MRLLRVGVQREVVIEFDYSGMIQFLMDAILSAGVSETKHNNLPRIRQA